MMAVTLEELREMKELCVAGREPNEVVQTRERMRRIIEDLYTLYSKTQHFDFWKRVVARIMEKSAPGTFITRESLLSLQVMANTVLLDEYKKTGIGEGWKIVFWPSILDEDSNEKLAYEAAIISQTVSFMAIDPNGKCHSLKDLIGETTR